MVSDVVPFAGTWIEIAVVHMVFQALPLSFPSRERGLKSFVSQPLTRYGDVVPFAGTWIEISPNTITAPPLKVVPFAGTWIEILLSDIIRYRIGGRSLRGNVD